MASQSLPQSFAPSPEIQPTPTNMTATELHQEIRERRALARHARRMGKRNARRWHIQLALNARAELRYHSGR